MLTERYNIGMNNEDNILMTQAEERFRMGRMLNLNPHDPSSWPIETIDRLIALEKNCGRDALKIELIKMTTPPR